MAKAQVLDTNDCQNIRYYNVHLAIAPDGGGLPSALLKRDLADFLERRKVITVEVNLFDPIYRPIDIDAEVYAWPGEALENVRSRIEVAACRIFCFRPGLLRSDGSPIRPGRPDRRRARRQPHESCMPRSRISNCAHGEIPVLGNVNLDLRRAE